MTPQPQPHLRLATIDGEIARDEAIDQVLAAASPAWKRAMRDLVYNLPEGWEWASWKRSASWPHAAATTQTHVRGLGESRRPRFAAKRFDTKAPSLSSA